MPEEEDYRELGRRGREDLISALPEDWSFDGRRVLDFGCGAGRVLRWFAAEAERCEFMGCEIDAPSVAWMEEHLSPPFRVFQSSPEPPLPLEDDSLDLVYAVSVFTHLDASWARWLVELHRVLRPDGILIATFLGDGIWPQGYAGSRGVPYDDRVGIYVEAPWRDFVSGHGPAVWHSEWWLREHWGRLFEIERLETRGVNRVRGHDGQGWMRLRPRDVRLEPEELERPGDDPRELPAALHAGELLRREFVDQMHHTLGELQAVRSSRIMRLSEPVRRAWYRVKRDA